MSVIINSGVCGTASHESSLTSGPLQLNTPCGTSGSGTLPISQVIGLQATLDGKLNDVLSQVGTLVVATGADINLLAGTSLYGLTTADLQKLADVTATAVEIDTLVGVTGPIQAQIDAAYSDTDFVFADQMIVSTGAGVAQVATVSDVLGGVVGIGYQFGNLVAPTASLDVNAQFVTNMLDPINPQDAATKNYVDTVAAGGVFLPLAGGTMTGSLDMSGQAFIMDVDGDTFISSTTDDEILFTMDTASLTMSATGFDMGALVISNMADPVAPQDAVTLNAMTNALVSFAPSFFRTDGTSVMAGDIDAGTNAVINVADPVNPQDAVTLAAMNAAITVGAATALLIDGSNAMTADVDMGGFNLANISTPTSGTDVGNRNYNDLRYLQVVNDLSDLASVPNARSNLGLATVAATGDYNDLINTPTAIGALDDLSDVNVGTPAAPQDDFVVTWDNAAGEYVLQAALVTSVFGRTGAVVSVSGDYAAGQVTNAPSGNVAAITVQTAIDELDGDKLARDGSQLMSGALNMGNNTIGNLANPTGLQEAVTVDYLNTAVATANAAYLDLAGAGVMTGDLDAGGNSVENVAAPTVAGDAVNLGYVEGLGMNRVLGTVTGIDLQTLGDTAIYTLPAGKMHIITQVIVRLTSYVPGVSPTMPSVSVGIGGPNYDHIVDTSQVNPGVGGAADQAVYLSPKDGAATPNAVNTISIQVDTAAAGTISAFIATIYVMGVEL